MMGVGRTLIYHASNASFPSHHMIFFSAVFISIFLAKEYKLSMIFFILMLLVAWSRIYLGVHFPFDMIGAFLISLCVSLLFEPIWIHIKKHYHRFFDKIQAHPKVILKTRISSARS